MMRHLLIMYEGWQEMHEAEATEASDIKHKVFPCGHCSNERWRVYHNVLGRHAHLNLLGVTLQMFEQKIAEAK